jgi:hypothetical protein
VVSDEGLPGGLYWEKARGAGGAEREPVEWFIVMGYVKCWFV